MTVGRQARRLPGSGGSIRAMAVAMLAVQILGVGAVAGCRPAAGQSPVSRSAAQPEPGAGAVETAARPADRRRSLAEAAAGPRPWRTLSAGELSRGVGPRNGRAGGTYDPFAGLDNRRWVVAPGAGPQGGVALVGVSKDGDAALIVSRPRSGGALQYVLTAQRRVPVTVDRAYIAVDTDVFTTASVTRGEEAAQARWPVIIAPGRDRVRLAALSAPDAAHLDRSVACGRRLLAIRLQAGAVSDASYVFDLRQAPFDQLTLPARAGTRADPKRSTLCTEPAPGVAVAWTPTRP